MDFEPIPPQLPRSDFAPGIVVPEEPLEYAEAAARIEALQARADALRKEVTTL